VNARVAQDSAWSDVDCATFCDELVNCRGYGFSTQSNSSGRCFLYGRGVDLGLPAYLEPLNLTWVGYSQPSFDIAGASGESDVVCQRKGETI
jgi:hypothetical protein